MKSLRLSFLCLLAILAACNTPGNHQALTDSTGIAPDSIPGFEEMVRGLPMLNRENYYNQMKEVTGTAIVPAMIREGYKDVRVSVFRKTAAFVALYFQCSRKIGYDHGFLYTFDSHGKVIDYEELENYGNDGDDHITNRITLTPVFVNDSIVQGRKYEYSFDNQKEDYITNKASIITYRLTDKGEIVTVPMVNISFADYEKLFPVVSQPLTLTSKPNFPSLKPVSLLLPFLDYKEYASDPKLAYYHVAKMQAGKFSVLIYAHDELSNGGEMADGPSYELYIHKSDGTETFHAMLQGEAGGEYYSDKIDKAIINADGSIYQHEILENTFYDIQGDNDLKTVMAMLLRVNEEGRLTGVTQRYELSSESFSENGVKQVLADHMEQHAEDGHSYAQVDLLSFKKPVYLYRHVYAGKEAALVELLLVGENREVSDRLIMHQTPGVTTVGPITTIPKDNFASHNPGAATLIAPAQIMLNGKWIYITPEGKFSETH
ncbi:hypothetical protein [Chitinophaga sp. sic0106]|uniref:hypothetical protein n=1 Tax=Chitinophaga sp. sic0106 TaxID=2854785 RepID=UPI001C47F94F|nr:hypothetical protein [Chitinophaga sp. sic0106]MBV7530083.1 hypothetical protein [Chitinophaga sp. sic0106]